jgi:hypothetical protein
MTFGSAEDLAMKEGQRSVVLDIINKLKIDTAKREQFIREYNNYDDYGI